MSKQVEVRVRHADNSEGVRLTDWPIDELDQLIKIIDAWGFSVDEVMEGCTQFGQFVFNEGEQPHFEIVYGGGE